VTTHSAVRNGRVFDLKLSALKAQTPSVVTYNSCTSHFFLPVGGCGAHQRCRREPDPERPGDVALEQKLEDTVIPWSLRHSGP
jgi:hypothetical protein